MILLPSRTVPLASELPPAALTEQLRCAIGSGPEAPFAGSVAVHGFVIRGMREFRSSFMPLVRGEIIARRGGGSLVRLWLRPAGIVLVFMGIWLSFLAAAGALIIAAHVRDAGRNLAWLTVPSGLAAVTWLLAVSVFDAEARWAVLHLLEQVPALRPETSLHAPPAEPAGRVAASAGGRCERRN
jgi:hypothetical protein